MPKTYIQSLLGQGETILFTTRQHWFLLLRSTLLQVLVIIAVLIAAVLLGVFIPSGVLGQYGPWVGGILLVLVLALLIVPLVSLINNLLIWRSRIFVVTNRRVMQLAGVLNKSVTDSSLEKVNDVKMEQSALGRIFNFGNVEILTASELGVNQFHEILDPVRFKTTMINAKQRLEMETSRGGDARSRDEFGPYDIPAMIANLDQLRQKGILTEEEFQSKKKELLAKL